jgi:hypothetical protein
MLNLDLNLLILNKITKIINWHKYCIFILPIIVFFIKLKGRIAYLSEGVSSLPRVISLSPF